MTLALAVLAIFLHVVLGVLRLRESDRIDAELERNAGELERVHRELARVDRELERLERARHGVILERLR